MKSSQADFLYTGVRIAFWLALLLWAAWQWGIEYARLLSPLYREVLDFALGDFRVLDFSMIEARETVFSTKVLATQYLFIHGKVLPSGFTVDASTPLYVALIPPVVLGTAVLAWPGLTWHGRALRLALSLPFLLLLAALDVPLVLASSVHDLLSYSTNPQADQASRLVDWVHVMDGGGRIVMSLSAAVIVAALQEALQRCGAGK
jgi:hypothetical protein